MSQKLSVVIPTLNASASLPNTLATLMEGVFDEIVADLIISDGGSTDGTIEIAHEVGATLVTSRPSRGGQIAVGVSACKSDWILILHADSCLGAGWSSIDLGSLDVDCAYYSRLRFDADTLMARCVASWANIRSRLFALPYGDQGLLIHKSLLSSIDGYPSPPIMEDVVIARKLGWRLRALPTIITTSADKYIKQGWTRRGARNLMMLLQFLLGASPEKLYKKYYS